MVTHDATAAAVADHVLFLADGEIVDNHERLTVDEVLDHIEGADAHVMTALVLAGLAERRLRSALTGLAILLGVAMIAGTYVMTDQIRRAFTQIEATANPGNALVVTARQAFQSDISYALPTFSQRAVARVAGVDGVARAQGQLKESGSLVLGGKRVRIGLCAGHRDVRPRRAVQPAALSDRPAAAGGRGLDQRKARRR